LKRFLSSFFLLMVAVGSLMAGPDSDWAGILSMDSGPQKKPTTQEEARTSARLHLSKQRVLVDAFVAKYPADSRAFEARMRAASLLATIGKLDRNQRLVDGAMRAYAALEKQSGATSKQRADAAFRRISLYMQSLQGREIEMRGSLVDSARNFVSRYPGDNRGPRLLVEVATICDYDPILKRALLEDARQLSLEDDLSRRIADDLTRLNLLGKPLDLSFKTLQGGWFDVAALRGNVVVLVFWSAESPHSILWLDSFRRGVSSQPQANVRLATFALDSKAADVFARAKELGIEKWPTGFDGQGWESSTTRRLGINALPTVFVLDKSGVLRATNARDSVSIWVRRLLAES